MSRFRTRTVVDSQLFGENLRRIRQLKNMSQEDLAFAMNLLWQQAGEPGKISIGWVKRIEGGTVQSVNRTRILYAAEALNVPVTQLLPTSQTPESETSTETDIVLTLRRYGLSDDQIEEFLIAIRRAKHDRSEE